MFPVLFSIGKISVSSFGIFLVLGFILGLFLIWRLARAWDLDEEKVLDLALLTLIGGLIGARVYFVIENLQMFTGSYLNVILVNKVPGFSFWGGFLGGWLTLYLFARRKKLDFWQLIDIASVGLIGGLILSELGCFFGGCNIGIPSKAFFAVTQIGAVGKRWPVQILEALFLTITLLNIWSQATHFHQRGKIAGLGLLFIGIIKLILEPLRQNRQDIIFVVSFIILGLIILFRVTKQNPVILLKKFGRFLVRLPADPLARNLAVQKISKCWYNQVTHFSWKVRNFKKFLRRFNVKFS